MQNTLKEEKQKIRNQIKRFLKEEGIEFSENERRIEVKGNIFYANVRPYVEISIRLDKKLGEGKYLTVEEREDKIILSYFRAFPKEYRKDLEISKENLDYILPAIYFCTNKLVFLF